MKTIVVGKFEVGIDGQSGWFEHEEYGDEWAGELLFENCELYDFDGCAVLPKEVAEAIKKLDYEVDEKHFCMGEE